MPSALASVTQLVGIGGLAVGLAAWACRSGEPATPPPNAAVVNVVVDAALHDSSSAPAPCPVATASFGDGLAVERWSIGAEPIAGGPGCIDIVRADLSRYRLLAASGADRNAPTWAEALRLVAVTNAGMFHDDGAPVGLVFAGGVARGKDNAKMSGYLAWDPVDPKSPAVAIHGRDCAGFDLATLRQRYRSIVQSYRFLGCHGEALPWKDEKRYSAVAIGVDRAGRVVFAHARAAVLMRELSAALAAHDLAGALFLEGGPEASLVVRGPRGVLERVGSYETGFNENDDNTAFWTLPNVIGLAAR